VAATSLRWSSLRHWPWTFVPSFGRFVSEVYAVCGATR
jgi:hypothetical protein